MGGGCQPHHTPHVLAHQTHTVGLAWKKKVQGGCEGVYECAHKRAWSCVCAVSGKGFSVDDERQ